MTWKQYPVASISISVITIQLRGGLGNQLFQYAMARSIALRHQEDLQLDLTFFRSYKWHAYSLAPFSIKASIAEENWRDKILKQQNSISNRLLRKFGFSNFLVYEKSLQFNQAYKDIRPNAYLIGFWQSENYFSHYASQLRKDLQITVHPSEDNAKLLSNILSCESVSLHIRRGNYVSVPSVYRVHGTCSIDYYRLAVKYLKEKLKNPSFFVFSDDINWAKENFKGDDRFYFVDLNDASHDYEDLRLMMNCNHHIIANSTFSWWAAWLNPSPSKLVIAPSRWFADQKKDMEVRELVPKNWIRL
jgi:hypothetical protein